jgi:hypothetical protein
LEVQENAVAPLRSKCDAGVELGSGDGLHAERAPGERKQSPAGIRDGERTRDVAQRERIRRGVAQGEYDADVVRTRAIADMDVREGGSDVRRAGTAGRTFPRVRARGRSCD